MIGRLNHVAIAVRDLAAATAVYRQTLGADVSDPVALPEHGVTTVFVTLPNTKIELLEPLGPDFAHCPFPGAQRRWRHPPSVLRGGRHPRRARAAARARRPRVLGDGEPKIGAHGKPVLFLHPKDFGGTLIELEQA